MNTARNILNLVGGLLFVAFALYLIVFQRTCLKKETFKLAFNGIVISTLEEGKRKTQITIEIMNGESRCYILVSSIQEKRIYPQYRDSIFKEPGSDFIYLKKDQTNEIVPMDGIDCLDINCKTEKQ